LADLANIRAIETRYNGYRFRSRLEARWAVFLDHCKEQYIYEHQGFELPSGPYLPDFFLPRRTAFIEVKPIHLLPISHFEFWRVNKGLTAPASSHYPIRDDNFPREIVQLYELYAALKLAPHMGVVVYGDPIDVVGFGDGGSVCMDKHGLRTGIGVLDWFHNLMDAADVARAARFEHGEQG
jgi:hypothetical protein